MRRGFTLIELLAVIVILAIIALIAVPIVLNIINDSKNSSDDENIKLYINAVEKALYRKVMNNSGLIFNPNHCEIRDNGKIECYENGTSLGYLEIEITGIQPKSGIIITNQGKISYNIETKDGIFTLEEKKKVCKSLVGNLSLIPGTKYECEVKDKVKYNFYVLSFNSDNTVNLIMDRNICTNGNATNNNNSCLMA